MPKNLTDVSTFTAPIVVPVGTDPRTAASVELAVQGVTNRTRLMANRTRDADAEFKYVDDTGTTITKTRRLRIPGHDLKPRNATFAASADGTAGRLQLDTNIGRYDAYFSLPAGVRIVAVRALVTPGAARTLSDKVELSCLSRPVEPFSVAGYGAASALFSPVGDDGTTAFQVIAATGLAHDVVEQDVHIVSIKAGSTATADPDSVQFIEVEYTATGPRSY